jgi:chromosome segregation ATPase
LARLYLILIILGILGGGGFAAKSYFDWSQETITTLRTNNVKLQDAAETLQNTVDRMVADAARNEELNKNLTQQLQQSQEHLTKLRGVFAKIDLTMEALTDAQNLEERVNNAVEKLIERIADETDPNPSTADDADGVPGEDSGADGSNTN